MAKTYAESVKLPNLVSVAHPATKLLPKNRLNIEGRNNSGKELSFFTERISPLKNFDRKSYITSLIENDDLLKLRKFRDFSQINSDQVMEMISEKLTTGYHGVKHLFSSNDLKKNGLLTKEAFRCVLNQLCGYLSNETWNKIIQRFHLNEVEGISFEEFISHFENNQKVKKELSLFNNSVEMMNISKGPMMALLAQRDMSKKNNELSAIYCYAAIRSKARESNFDPKNYLPEECFSNNCLVMPYHLSYLLEMMNLSLTSDEFQKLWQKFDLNNVGGVKINIFLRLIEYKPNSLDEMIKSMDILRTKSCIVDKLRPTLILPAKRSYLLNTTTSSSNLKQVESLDEEKVPNTPSEKAQSRSLLNKSILSETKIKSMVQILKKTSFLDPNDDLIMFLNNKMNQGFISLRTAFEYIDPDQLNHLLDNEFSVVLDEFRINADEPKTLNEFLKKHCLLKHGELVDYEKFLKIFRDRATNSLTAKYGGKLAQTNDPIKVFEHKLVEFFHEIYYYLYNAFKEATGDKPTCSSDEVKRILDQKLWITVSEEQLDSLLKFIDQFEKKDQVNWIEIFKKFSEIDPWNFFKETYEHKLKNKKESIKNKLASSKLNNSAKKLEKCESDLNEKENFQTSENEGDDDEIANFVNFSSDDESFNKQSISKRRKDKKIRKELTELEKSIENLFRTKFHTINKEFGLLDPNHEEKINKILFKTLLEKCGLSINDAQSDKIWKEYDSDLIPFSNIVRRFLMPNEFNKIRNIRDKIKLEKEINEETKKKHKSKKNKFDSLEKSRQENTTSFSDDYKLIPNYIMEKAKNSIYSNWSQLKKEFEFVDSSATIHIPNKKAVEIFKKIGIPLEDEELFELCRIFDFNSNGSDIDYVRFLRFFNTTNTSSSNAKTFQPNWNNIDPTLKQIIFKLREMFHTKLNDPNLLIKDLSNVRTAFKKFDSARRGHLTSGEFKQLLAHVQIQPNLDEMYLMQSDFDPELKGVFCYEMFLRSLVDKMILNE